MGDLTDRALLEAAAKAGGIEGRYDSWTHQGFNEGIRRAGHLRPWNPLTNDGDALRLAVRLDLLTSDGTYSYEPDEWRIDPYAATRRAIVRAAAAIGAKQQ